MTKDKGSFTFELPVVLDANIYLTYDVKELYKLLDSFSRRLKKIKEGNTAAIPIQLSINNINTALQMKQGIWY